MGDDVKNELLVLLSQTCSGNKLGLLRLHDDKQRVPQLLAHKRYVKLHAVSSR